MPKAAAAEHFGADASVLLFGSCADDSRKGGKNRGAAMTVNLSLLRLQDSWRTSEGHEA